MKFFLDTANIDEIKKYAQYGMVDGVTTNPSLIVKNKDLTMVDIIHEIAKIIPGPVSAEVVATNYQQMMKEAEILRKIADNVAIKVPLTIDGLRCCHDLSKDGTMVNATLCFAPMQALLAAKAGAKFISPFVGRLDDINQNGMELISNIKMIFDNYHYDTEILVASIRHTAHILAAAEIGADIVTIPPNLLEKCYQHPLTDKGLEVFLSDWANSEQKNIA